MNMCDNTDIVTADVCVISARSLTSSGACEGALAMKSIISLTSNDPSVNQIAKLLLDNVVGRIEG